MLSRLSRLAILFCTSEFIVPFLNNKYFGTVQNSKDAQVVATPSSPSDSPGTPFPSILGISCQTQPVHGSVLYTWSLIVVFIHLID